MIHTQVYGFFQTCLPDQAKEVKEYFPNGIEVTASNHQVGAFLNDKLRIDFYYTTLRTTGRNH